MSVDEDVREWLDRLELQEWHDMGGPRLMVPCQPTIAVAIETTDRDGRPCVVVDPGEIRPTLVPNPLLSDER